ncbi:hypothetical protein [Kitasatospora sp. NPDC057541]|uniref:hypothetical protein n=1 Tax=unclassified Kitasatospora TaxID=2633591 RepID=UPI003691EB14
MNATRATVTRTATVLATLALLVSVSECSLLKREGVERAGGPVGAEGPAEPPPAPSPPVVDTRTVADWPDRPVTGESALPPLRARVIEPGYTGETFLKRLAAGRGITLKEREKVDFPGPPVWHAAGEKADGGVVEWIAAVWSFDGELERVTCSVTATAVDRIAFLRQCAGADRPAGTPAEVRAWLDGMVPRVDELFATGPGLTVTSPLLRRGATAAFLRKWHREDRGGDTYELHLFGTGAGN